MARLEVLTDEAQHLHGDLSAEELQQLHDYWQCWVGIVEDFARRVPRRRYIAEEQYTTLLCQLLEACRLAEDSDPAGHKLYESMRDLAAPWLSISQLENTSPAFLTHLLRQCHELSPGGQTHCPRFPNHPVQALWLVALMLLLARFLVLSVNLVQDLMGAARGGWLSLSGILTGLSSSEWLVLYGQLVVLLILLRVIRPQKRGAGQ